MTTYIPALTIPHGVFANPAASILLPIGLGTAVGYSTRRKLHAMHNMLIFPIDRQPALTTEHSKGDTKDLQHN